MRNSALLGFPAWFCTQKQTKQFSWHSYWNLQMIFPTQIDLGTSAFHPLLFVTSYVLPVWYNLDLFFYETSLSAIVFCLSTASPGRAVFQLPGRVFKLLSFNKLPCISWVVGNLHRCLFFFFLFPLHLWKTQIKASSSKPLQLSTEQSCHALTTDLAYTLV